MVGSRVLLMRTLPAWREERARATIATSVFDVRRSAWQAWVALGPVGDDVWERTHGARSGGREVCDVVTADKQTSKALPK